MKKKVNERISSTSYYTKRILKYKCPNINFKFIKNPIHSDEKLYKNYRKKIALANKNILFITTTELIL